LSNQLRRGTKWHMLQCNETTPGTWKELLDLPIEHAQNRCFLTEKQCNGILIIQAIGDTKPYINLCVVPAAQNTLSERTDNGIK
jgi:hypothetical protein